MSRGRRVAVLGGGMAGLSAAWRLSERRWSGEIGQIVVYQRGWRLGGKGASSRGRHGRIEEHGLHVWLGYYDNAFRLLRECYAELDRATRDPAAPIATWRDALVPATLVGLEERWSDRWSHWVGDFTENDDLPGEPLESVRPFTIETLVARMVDLVGDFVESVPDASPPGSLSSWPQPDDGGDRRTLQILIASIGTELVRLATTTDVDEASHGETDRSLVALAGALEELVAREPGLRRAWHLVSVVIATVRGMVADRLLWDPGAIDDLNSLDYREWITNHGAAPEAVESTLVGGLYDLVFANEGGRPGTSGFAAGLGVVLCAKTFFDYKGAIFWKMTAGMGDVVFAPLYEALRQRGVQFEFFHRVDALHPSDDDTIIESVTLGRQATVTDGSRAYQPLVRHAGLPCFPPAPLADQLVDGAAADRSLESHWCPRDDAETITLRRGVDYDDLVCAMSLGMLEHTCSELVDRRPLWASMVGRVTTVATQALQVWLRPAEHELGWPNPGSTVTAFEWPFDTWASMPQTIAAEGWLASERPGTIAYFCSTFDAAPPPPATDRAHPERERARVRANAVELLDERLGHLLPGAVDEQGFRWGLLCGGEHGDDRDLDTQHYLANVDPSDRYVQSLPGTIRYRLRPDESGYDNLVLAGDWTDNGLNAGCIEAAVLSGLQAANALLGRHRWHRVSGFYLR